MSNSPIFDSVIADVSDVTPILDTQPPSVQEILNRHLPASRKALVAKVKVKEGKKR